MVGESLAITIVILVMLFLFLRAHKKNHALSCAPLITVPVFVIIGRFLQAFILTSMSDEWLAFIYIIGLAVGVALVGVASILFKTKKSKIMYIVICGGFETTLTIIYLYNLKLVI